MIIFFCSNLERKLLIFFTSSCQTVQNIKLKFELVKWMIKEGSIMKTEHDVMYMYVFLRVHLPRIMLLLLLKSYARIFDCSKGLRFKISFIFLLKIFVLSHRGQWVRRCLLLLYFSFAFALIAA